MFLEWIEGGTDEQRVEFPGRPCEQAPADREYGAMVFKHVRQVVNLANEDRLTIHSRVHRLLAGKYGSEWHGQAAHHAQQTFQRAFRHDHLMHVGLDAMNTHSVTWPPFGLF